MNGSVDEVKEATAGKRMLAGCFYMKGAVFRVARMKGFAKVKE